MLGQLAEYCAKPNPSTMLVLILPGEPDGRLKAVKAVKKAGYLIPFQMPAEPKVIAWATEQAKARLCLLGGPCDDLRLGGHLKRDQIPRLLHCLDGFKSPIGLAR